MKSRFYQRVARPAAAKLHSIPLQIKLLAAVLAVVIGALSLISVASTFALRSYLFSRADDELAGVAQFLASTIEARNLEQLMQVTIQVPSEYMFALRNANGVGSTYYNTQTL